MYIVFDTETTGLPKDWKAPVSQVDNWPRLVQLGWMRFDAANEVVEEANLIIYPDGFVIPKEASRIHGISQARALVDGLPVADVLTRFVQALEASQFVIAHNLDYDEKVMGAEFIRAGVSNPFKGKNMLCTKTAATDYCQLAREVWFQMADLGRITPKTIWRRL